MSQITEFKLDPRDGTATFERANGQVESFNLSNTVVRDLTTGVLRTPDGRSVGGGYFAIAAQPGIDCSQQVSAAIESLRAQGGGTLHFPYIGGVGYHISQRILIDFSDVTVILEDDLRYTGTSPIPAVIHFRGAISPARYIDNVSLVAPRRVTIDGNGRNLVGYVQPAPGSPSGTMFCVWFQFCRNIHLENIYAYNGIAGGIIGSYCLGGKLVNPEASDVLYDNGIYFYNNGEHYGLPSENDPSTWANIEVKNAKAWNCANHGVGVYGAIGVTYENPKVWNCGNNQPTGADGQPRAAGPAGGIGIEFDSNTDPEALLDYRCTIINPQVTRSWGFGIRTNCRGTEVRGGFVRGSRIPTAYTDDATVPIWGSGVFVQNNASAVVTCDIVDCQRHGIRVQGGTGQFPTLRFDGLIQNSAYEAIQGVSVGNVVIAPTSRFVDNGRTGPNAATSGYFTVNINNSVLNTDGGYVALSGRFDNNGGQVAQINRIGDVDLRAISGKNNCSVMTAAARHAIYIPNSVNITASTIMLIGSAMTRILKVDASTKAIIDRQSILGDQTNAALPRADVVSTNLIADVFSTAAPSAAPAYANQRWVDTNLNKVYWAKAASSAADWLILN